MLKQNRDDWKLVKDKLEIGIMEKYSYTARFFAIILMGKNSNVCVTASYI